MWVMIIRGLPTMGVDEGGEARVIKPPPMLSIHWAVPWTNAHYVHIQQRNAVILAGGIKTGRGRNATWALPDGSEVDEGDLVSEDDLYGPSLVEEVVGGFEVNWKGALKINWDGVDVRVFPHEISKLKAENMHAYVFGDGESESTHELVAATVAEQQLITGQIDNDMRPAWEAALLDGCTPDQATAVMLGQDIFDDSLEFAPIGWYRAKPEVMQSLGFQEVA